MEGWDAQADGSEAAAVPFGDDDELESLPEDNGEEAWRLAQLGTVLQAARRLRVCEKTVRKMIGDGDLSCNRVRGAVRVEERDIRGRWPAMWQVGGSRGTGQLAHLAATVQGGRSVATRR